MKFFLLCCISAVNILKLVLRTYVVVVSSERGKVREGELGVCGNSREYRI